MDWKKLYGILLVCPGLPLSNFPGLQYDVQVYDLGIRAVKMRGLQVALPGNIIYT